MDPFPFGGGVTTFESLAMCTPVITAPSLQSVPALAKGIIETLQLSKEYEDMLIIDRFHSVMNRDKRHPIYISNNSIIDGYTDHDSEDMMNPFIRQYIDSIYRMFSLHSSTAYPNDILIDDEKVDEAMNDSILIDIRRQICSNRHKIFEGSKHRAVDEFEELFTHLGKSI